MTPVAAAPVASAPVASDAVSGAVLPADVLAWLAARPGLALAVRALPDGRRYLAAMPAGDLALLSAARDLALLADASASGVTS